MIILPIYVKVNYSIERMLFQFDRSCNHLSGADIRRTCRWLVGNMICFAASWQECSNES